MSGRFDAFQPRSAAEERAAGIGECACARCRDSVDLDWIDDDGHCPECAADARAELDAEDPDSDLSQELSAHYDSVRAALDHELPEMPWHLSWAPAAA